MERAHPKQGGPFCCSLTEILEVQGSIVSQKGN
jgi:hypothetical protein